MIEFILKFIKLFNQNEAKMKNEFTAKDAIKNYQRKLEESMDAEFNLIIGKIKETSEIPELSCKFDKEINKINTAKLTKLGFNVMQEKQNNKCVNTISWDV